MRPPRRSACSVAVEEVRLGSACHPDRIQTSGAQVPASLLTFRDGREAPGEGRGAGAHGAEAGDLAADGQAERVGISVGRFA